MSVCLSSESALFTGPPDPQKEEFFMFGLDDPAETLLDSIQKTFLSDRGHSFSERKKLRSPVI